MTDSTTDNSTVLYEVRDRTCWITLNRPSVLNALNPQLVTELLRHVERAAADPEALLVMVRGTGRAFCSGIDRTALANGSVTEQFFRNWIRALNWLEDMPKLTVGVLHSYSIGGGLQLALACDIRVATDDAIIELGATRHGLVPDGAALRIARVVGMGRAKQLALLNDRVSPEEARSMGLVNYVCAPSELDGFLKALVLNLRGISPTAIAETKRLINMSFHSDPRQLTEELIASQRICTSSWEIGEANQAWTEKREPQFDQKR